MLHKNQLEFIFISDYIIEEKDSSYVIKEYIEDSLKLIVGNGHRLFKHKFCSLFDVIDDLYITKESTSSQYKFLDKIFKKCDFDFTNKLFISHQEAIKESVINNLGISILSINSVKRELQSGLVTALDFEEVDIYRKIQYIYIKDKILTPAAKEFLKLVSK